MKDKLTFNALLVFALFLTLPPIALADTTWYVDGVHGSNGNNCKAPATACKTIGHAISLAASGDSIRLAAATYTENLAIGINLNVIGAGARTTIIDGNEANIVIDIYNRRVVTLSNITIRHGFHSFGAGIDNENGLLTINNSTISGNTSFVPYCCAAGGGIYNNGSGVLTINNTTVTGNSTGCGSLGCAARGGGIYNNGMLVINNSTIAGNTRVGPGALQGGGIGNYGVLLINNSTLSGNRASLGGGIWNYGGAYGYTTAPSAGIRQVSAAAFTAPGCSRTASLRATTEETAAVLCCRTATT
jgi:hypothetical protein